MSQEKINIDNYEAYLLDLAEGNLAVGDKEALFAFMKKHPEFSEDYEFALGDDWNNILPNYSEQLNEHNTLKIQAVGSVNSENYEDLFISFHEGLLNQAEKESVIAFMEANPITKKEFWAFEKTMLIPDTSITYPQKNKLRKGIVISLFSSRSIYYSAAAVIIILLGFTFWNNIYYKPNIPTPIKGELAEVNTGAKDSSSSIQKNLEEVDRKTETGDKQEKLTPKKSLPEEKQKTPIPANNGKKERVNHPELNFYERENIKYMEMVAYNLENEKHIDKATIVGSSQIEPAHLPYFDQELEQMAMQEKGYKTIQEVMEGAVKEKLNVAEEVPIQNGVFAALKRSAKKYLGTSIEVERNEATGNNEVTAFTTPFFQLERSKQ